jgi:hypothetical protein
MLKKIVYVFVLSMAFIACKKEYSCNCSQGIGGASISKGTVKALTKKKAESACNALSSSGEACIVN